MSGLQLVSYRLSFSLSFSSSEHARMVVRFGGKRKNALSISLILNLMSITMVSALK